MGAPVGKGQELSGVCMDQLFILNPDSHGPLSELHGKAIGANLHVSKGWQAMFPKHVEVERAKWKDRCQQSTLHLLY